MQRRVQAQAQFAGVGFIGGRFAQHHTEQMLAAQQQVGEGASGQLQQRAAALGQRRLAGAADEGMANRFVVEQPFDHLFGHGAVQGQYGLGGRVAEHAQDALGLAVEGLAGLLQGVEDLYGAQQQADGQGAQQGDLEQFAGQAAVTYLRQCMDS